MIKKIVLLVCMTVVLPAQAALDEQTAKELSADFAAAVSAATGVISGLQQEISSGALAEEKVEKNAFLNAFQDKFKSATGKTYDTQVPGIMGEYRTNLQTAIAQVISEFRKDMLKGGQDAFVPAFFRAQMLSRFNRTMGGKLSGHVTNSDDMLINTDSAVDFVLEGSPLKEAVADLLKQKSVTGVDKVIKGHYMSFRPMKLQESCVACHGRNGVQQQVGEFGGALVVDVPLL